MNNKQHPLEKYLLQKVVALIVPVILLACQPNDKRQGIDPQPQFKASDKIENSFKSSSKVTASPGLGAKENHVEIQRKAFDKEFLLSANILSQSPTPMFSSLESRVVSFIQRDNKIILLDVTKNHEVGTGHNIPQHLLLAEFPILTETTDSVIFDFNAGMNQIFTNGAMFASDDPPFGEAHYNLPKMNIRISYLDEVSLKNNSLFIKQVTQAEFQADNNLKVIPYEIRYQIKPYLPNLNFQPTLSPGFVNVGYFEANPLLLKDGSTRVYAMKWDTQKPIEFALSANTPMEYRDLISSAVLYWNKILGPQAVKVTQLTDESLTAPQFDQNIIQWADFDGAGYAFADAHIDPRSGEITSAQVFFPSAFFTSNMGKRLRLLQSAMSEEANSESKKHSLTLKGFKQSSLCHRNILKDLSQSTVSTLLEDPNTISPEKLNQAIKDYIYEVIAHEVGHLMGLRHNFAGNLVANYDFKDRKPLILNYFKSGKAPQGIIASSSVMEYSRFEESAWNGNNLQNPNTPALSYDQIALDFLYKGQAVPENHPPFCTDSQMDSYVDCNMSDAGRSVLSAASGAYQYSIETLPAKILNTYISLSKSNDDGHNELLIDVKKVNLSAKSLAQSIGSDFAKTVSLLDKNAHFIKTRSQFLPVLSFQKSDIEQKERNEFLQDLHRLGGFEIVLPQLPESFTQDFQKKLTDLLNNPQFTEGTRADGTKYSFNEDEKKTILANSKIFAEQFFIELNAIQIQNLRFKQMSFSENYGQTPIDSDTISLANSEASDEFAKFLLTRFKYYISAKTGESIEAIVIENNAETKVNLPIYKFPLSLRISALSFFETAHDSLAWGYHESAAAEKFFEQETQSVDISKMDKSRLSKPELTWILELDQLKNSSRF